MGNNKYHSVAIRHWIWNHLFLLVHLCFVANLEFLDDSSSVYTIHGMHGSNPLSHFWDSWPASEWWIPYRLSFFTVWLRNSTDLDKEFLTYTNGWLVALLCGLKFCLKLAWPKLVLTVRTKILFILTITSVLSDGNAAGLSCYR